MDFIQRCGFRILLITTLIFQYNCQQNATNEIKLENTSNETSMKSDEDVIGYLGLANQSWSFCTDGTIFADRFIGKPPEEEVYWNGTFNMSMYKGIGGFAGLEIELDHPATITLDPNLARIRNLGGNSFFITIFEELARLDFVVMAPIGQPFPNIAKIILNSKPVCLNPRKWTPILLGQTFQAIASPLLPPSTVIPPCGRRKVDYTALVTKGEAIKEGDWPWHVALYLYDLKIGNKTYRCGGSIISTNTIVTAAHCVVNKRKPLPALRFEVVVGKHYLYEASKHAVELRVKTIYINTNFDPTNFKNDIAMVQTKDQIVYNDFVQPICLWNSKQIPKNIIYGEYGTVAGWGANENGTLSPTLNVGFMRVVSDTTCLLRLASFYNRFLNEKSFCAGNGPKNGTSACNGDSGGGLVMPIKQADDQVSWFLRGIVSVSVSRPDIDLCDPDYYVVFTDAAQYLDWLYDKSNVVRYEDL